MSELGKIITELQVNGISSTPKKGNRGRKGGAGPSGSSGSRCGSTALGQVVRRGGRANR